MSQQDVNQIGPYRLGNRLGSGATGTVWAATSPADDGAVALKTLRADVAADHGVAARFLQQGRLLHSIQHPNVVCLHDLVIDEDRLAIAMELVAGPDLRSLLDGARPRPKKAVALAEQIAAGLEAIHRLGVAHRDLKPENILLESDPATPDPRPKVTDFGLATLLGPKLTPDPRYTAPEATQWQTADLRSDVYSLGVIIFELLIGRTPSETVSGALTAAGLSDPTLSAIEGVPPPLSALLARMLAGEIERRPTVAEVRETLAASRSGTFADQPRVVTTPGAASVPQAGATPPPLRGGPGDEAAVSPSTVTQSPTMEMDTVALSDAEAGIGRRRAALGVLALIGAAAAVVVLAILAQAAQSNQVASDDDGQTAAADQDEAGESRPDQEVPSSATPDSTSGPSVVAPELSTCCWAVDYEPVADGSGVNANITFESSACATIRWYDPEDIVYQSASWPNPGVQCWTVHTRSFPALSWQADHTVRIELRDESGRTLAESYNFTTPGDPNSVGGPTICCWQTRENGSEVTVTFTASTCSTAAWTDPNGQRFLSPGWPDASVNCWIDHGHSFPNLSPGVTYSISVDLADESNRTGHGSFTFTVGN